MPAQVGLAAARLTAADGAQRRVDLPFEDLQALHDPQSELRELLSNDSQLARVRPWLWNAATSGGAALTGAGVEHGFELRLSRYADPLAPD